MKSTTAIKQTISLLAALLLTPLATVYAAKPAKSDSKPNILFILIDDLN